MAASLTDDTVAFVRLTSERSAGQAVKCPVVRMGGALRMAAAVALLGGCACGRDAETRNLTATLPVAAIVGNSALLASSIERDLGDEKRAATEGRSELLARAQVLAAHARSLHKAIDLYDPAGKANPSITLSNLTARGEALKSEYQTTMREWGIWQVRNGIKSPDQVYEVFDFGAAMR